MWSSCKRHRSSVVAFTLSFCGTIPSYGLVQSRISLFAVWTIPPFSISKMTHKAQSYSRFYDSTYKCDELFHSSSYFRTVNVSSVCFTSGRFKRHHAHTHTNKMYTYIVTYCGSAFGQRQRNASYLRPLRRVHYVTWISKTQFWSSAYGWFGQPHTHTHAFNSALNLLKMKIVCESWGRHLVHHAYISLWH